MILQELKWLLLSPTQIVHIQGNSSQDSCKPPVLKIVLYLVQRYLSARKVRTSSVFFHSSLAYYLTLVELL